MYHNHIVDIFVHYIKGLFIFDAAATLPCIIYGEDTWYYPFKLIRFIHSYEVYNFITNLFKDIYKKSAAPNLNKVSYVFDLLVYLLSAVHFLGCMWIYLGKKINGSWIRRIPASDINVNNNNNYDVYITSTYWVITTLTTVGYGDFKGYTPQEYLF